MTTPTSLSSVFINTDGGARGNPGPAAIGVVIADSADRIIYEQGIAIGKATNNEAEYRAAIHAVEWLLGHDYSQNSKLYFRLDSQLVVNQINRIYKVKEPRMQELISTLRKMLDQFTSPYSFAYVPRAQNKLADKLVNQALDAQK